MILAYVLQQFPWPLRTDNRCFSNRPSEIWSRRTAHGHVNDFPGPHAGSLLVSYRIVPGHRTHHHNLQPYRQASSRQFGFDEDVYVRSRTRSASNAMEGQVVRVEKRPERSWSGNREWKRKAVKFLRTLVLSLSFGAFEDVQSEKDKKHAKMEPQVKVVKIILCHQRERSKIEAVDDAYWPGLCGDSPLYISRRAYSRSRLMEIEVMRLFYC